MRHLCRILFPHAIMGTLEIYMREIRTVSITNQQKLEGIEKP